MTVEVPDPASWRAPDGHAILRLADVALDSLPPALRAAMGPVAVRVADFADEDTLDALGIEDAFDLTGLYHGVALTEKSAEDLAPLPDEVWLYRRAILEEWAERGDVSLGDLVRHIVIHEIAHHFGWSDDEIAAIDRWWE